MNKKLLSLFFAILLLFPVITNAKNKMNYTYEDDIDTHKTINGSSLVVGKNVNNEANVNGINIVLGTKVLDKSLSDYAIIAGEDVTVSGNYDKDILVLGSSVTVNGTINRDIVVLANDLTINGTISRDAKIYATKVIINDSTINGTVEIKANELKIDDKTTIGKIIHNEDIVLDSKKDFNTKSYKVESNEKNKVTNKITSYLTNLVYVLVFYAVLVLVFPNIFDKVKNTKCNLSNIVSTIGQGAFLLILGPIAILVSFMSAIGIYIGLLLIVLYILIIALSFIISSYYIGYTIWSKLIKKEENTLLIGLIGIVSTSIISLIPIVNIVIILFGMGLSLNYVTKK